MPPSSARQSRLFEGLPYPLGATWDGLGVNFALFSANATKVELCLFDEGGRREIERITLTKARSATERGSWSSHRSFRLRADKEVGLAGLVAPKEGR